MKTKSAIVEKNAKNLPQRLGMWALLVAVLLTIPVFARWPWGSEDFVAASIMLFGSASIYELVTLQMSNKTQKLIAGSIIFVILTTVWVLLATG